MLQEVDQRRTDRSAYLLMCLSAIIMVLWFSPTDNWAWDPSYYYAQIRSPLIEHDLDYRNETQTGGIATRVTVTGLQGSAYPIGPSILWAPFFLLAHGITLLVNPSAADGFSTIYIAVVSMGSVFYGILAGGLVFRICREYSSQRVASLISVLSIFATPLAYYMFRQPIMAHTTNVLMTAGMVLAYIYASDGRVPFNRSGLLFGVLLGLNVLTRWTSVLIAVIPGIFFLARFYTALIKKHPTGIIYRQVLIFMLSFGSIILPQFVLWYRLYNTIFTYPQAPNSLLSSTLPPNFFNVLFSTNRGLFVWNPFLWIGLLGLIWLKSREMKLAFSLYVGLLCFILGYRWDWYGGGGFGTRYFVEIIPIAAVGFAALAMKLNRRPIFLGIIGAVCLIQQAMLVYVFEQSAANHWIDYPTYHGGKPLGLQFQLDALAKLASNPGLWFTPTPNVSTSRQSIIVNLVNQEYSWNLYAITGLAALLAPLLMALALLVLRRFKKEHLTGFCWITMGYMLIWAIYLGAVGR